MNFREEKGITGIDITVTVIVITLFVALIATLLTAINTSSSAISKKTEATNYAISTIEELKAKSLEDVAKIEDESSPEYVEYNGYIETTPYYRKTEVIDYADLKADEGEYKYGLVKKVTVEISYKNGNNDEVVSISTVLTKGD